MSLITFKNLPDTTTPLNAENLNNNFSELNNIINSANSAGCVKIGKIGIEWGTASVTSSSTAVSQSGLNLYEATSDTINYQNTYSKIPSVITSWGAKYTNQFPTYATSKTSSSTKVGGYLLNASSTRTVNYLVIGVLSSS